MDDDNDDPPFVIVLATLLISTVFLIENEKGTLIKHWIPIFVIREKYK